MWRSRFRLIEINPLSVKLEILISDFQIIRYSINKKLKKKSLDG